MIFRKDLDYDVASFAMSILGLMSPMCQMVVEEWGCFKMGPITMARKAPPLAVLMISFCGDADDVRRALSATLEKAVATTSDTEKLNPEDKSAWKGVTVKSVWSILKLQSPATFVMSFNEFMTLNTQQRVELVLATLSPQNMRAQPISVYNLGTESVMLYPSDDPLAFTGDFKTAEKLESAHYCVVPNVKEVHSMWGRMVRPSIFVSPGNSQFSTIELIDFMSDYKTSLSLLNAAYWQIYEIPDNILCQEGKYNLCISVTKDCCRGNGSGINRSVSNHLVTRHMKAKFIKESKCCLDMLRRWRILYKKPGNSNDLFVDIIKETFSSLGLSSNTLPISWIMAICLSGPLPLPSNYRFLNISLLGPPGWGKSFAITLLSIVGQIVIQQQSATYMSLLTGSPLLGIPKLNVSDGTFGFNVSNDQGKFGVGKDGEELLQGLGYDGGATRKASCIDDGDRKPVKDSVLGIETTVAATNWPMENAAQLDRYGVIYHGPGGITSMVSGAPGSVTSHPSWNDMSTLLSTVILDAFTEFCTSSVQHPTMMPAVGWVSNIFKVIEDHGCKSQRFRERVARVTGSIMAMNQFMANYMAKISGEPSMSNKQLVLSMAAPLEESIMSNVACILSPILPGSTISDIYLPIIIDLSNYLEIDFQTLPGMYQIRGSISGANDLEKMVLEGIRAKNGIKIEKNRGTPIADILLGGGVIVSDVADRGKTFHVSISAVSSLVPTREREENIVKFLGMIKANIDLFNIVELYAPDAEGGSKQIKCIPLNKDFIKWMSKIPSESVTTIMQTDMVTPCKNFLKSVKSLRTAGFWSDLVNIGMIPTPQFSREHKIVDRVNPQKTTNEKQRFIDQPDVLYCNTTASRSNFLLPLSSIESPSPNISSIAKAIQKAPRLGDFKVLVSNNNTFDLKMNKSIRGAVPKLRNDGILMLDQNMEATMFPTMTHEGLVKATTMATTIAATSYKSLGDLSDTMIECIKQCSFPQGQKWDLPPEEEDNSVDNVSAVTMVARALVLLMCAYDQGLVRLSEDRVVSRCSLFKIIAEMIRGLPRSRMEHAWKFVEFSKTGTIPHAVFDSIVSKIDQFAEFASPQGYISTQRFKDSIAGETQNAPNITFI